MLVAVNVVTRNRLACIEERSRVGDSQQRCGTRVAGHGTIPCGDFLTLYFASALCPVLVIDHHETIDHREVSWCHFLFILSSCSSTCYRRETECKICCRIIGTKRCSSVEVTGMSGHSPGRSFVREAQVPIGVTPTTPRVMHEVRSNEGSSQCFVVVGITFLGGWCLLFLTTSSTATLHPSLSLILRPAHPSVGIFAGGDGVRRSDPHATIKV